MSRFEITQTEFTDAGHLAGALNDMGFQPEICKEVKHLIDYHGHERPDVANIIVPRHQIDSASNDMGFVLENGKYRAIISDYDRSNSRNAIGIPLDNTFLGKLAQKYAERKTMAVARQRGYAFQGREIIDGKVRLRFQVGR